ncbi:anthranilate phosphoribosyltransferase [Arthrobacter woluwensis]|uniref:anthranilate phosphoribosyltransferase n=1 Tax=Arthrobacter woluwensis TaxID=156980 RepID=UPI000D12E416|nr:anthranilate phosphoribosyltransferase [Arthrobacter woluwensis]PSS45183.1 anthranilate phosphoribosyltransferase [Arthrobacter woluwensis]
MSNDVQTPRVPWTWPLLISALVRGEDLPSEATAWAMAEVMDGAANPAQLAGFLVGLRAKGETVEEIDGLAGTMLARAERISIPGETLDIVGTGGDGLDTVNISTMSSLVVVGAGRTVVKHGNRGASTKAGSADVIEALGVRLDLPAQRVAEIAAEVGITLCFAQVFHPSFRHAGGVRRDLGIPTAFNVLGPLTNPAGVTAQALGVANERMAPLMAGVLARRGTRALVFRGDDGRDKITTSGLSTVWEVRDGEVQVHRLDPRDFGVELVPVEALKGSDADSNADLVRRFLAGEKGPVRDAVVLNAAAGLVAADAAYETPLQERLKEAQRVAEESIDSGAAADVLERWVQASRR